MAAGSPELRLGVSFDLESFKKTALPSLNQAASNFVLRINIKFDRTSINEEMRLLGRQLGQRKYRIDLNDASVKSAIDQVDKLAQKLSGLKANAGRGSVLTSVLSGVNLPQTRALYGSAKELGIVSGTVSRAKGELASELKAGFASAGEDAVKGLIQGILSGQGKLAGIAASLSNELLTALKQALEIQSPSRKMMEIGKQAGDGFNNGLIASMEEATRNAVAVIDASLKRLDRMVEMRQRKARAIAPGQPNFELAQAQLGALSGQRERVQNRAESIRLRAAANQFETGSEQSLSKQIQSLQIEASEIKPNTRDWNSLQEKISVLKMEMDKAARAAQEIQMRTELGAYAPGSLAALESRLVILKSRAREIAPNTTQWQEFNKEIQKAERLIEKATRKPLTGKERVGAAGGAFLYGGGLGGGVGSALGGIAGGLGGGVPGAFAGAAVGQIVDNLGRSLAGITAQAAKVQQLQRGLALASIDAKDFAESQAAVADTSKRLFIPIEQVTKSFAQLRVNTKQYGLSVQDTKEILEGTVLAVSAFGGSADDVDGAMRAVVQILSKGSVQAEELRGQLGERFPGAVVKFAQANKMSFEELSKGLEQGSIGVKEFVAFAEKNYEDYAQFSEKLATAPEFAGRRLQVALEQVGIAIGGVFTGAGADIQDTLTSTLNGISNFVKDNEQELKTIASGLASLVKLTEQAGSTITRIIGSDIARAFRDVAEAATTIRNLTGGGDIRSVAGERQTTSRRINEQFAKIGKLRKEGKTLELVEEETTLRSLQKRRDELDRQYRGMGGNAAYQLTKTGTTVDSSLSFGGAGAGMSIERPAKEEKEKAISLESFERLRDQLADAYNKAEIERIKQRYEMEKRLRDDLFGIQEAGANRLQRQNLSFIRALVAAERNRVEAVMDARLRVQESMGKTAEGAAAGVSVPSSGSIDKKVLRDWLISQGFGRTTGDFTNAGHATPNHTLNAMDMGILGGSDADALRKTIAMERKLRATGAFGSQLFGPERDPYGHGAGKGGQNIHLHIPTPGGKVPMTPGLASLMSAGGGAGLPRKVGSNESRDTVTEANTEIAKQSLLLTERNAEILKGSELTKAQAQYIADVFGLPDLSLDNRLLKARNKLVAEGVDENTINYRLRLVELDEQYSDLQKRLPDILKEIGVKEAERKRILDNLTLGLGAAREAEKAKNDETLRGLFVQEQVALGRRMTMAQALTPDQELRAQIGERFSGAEAEQIFQQTKAVQLMEKQKQQFQSIASSIGDSFGNAFKGIVTGSMTAREALAGFFQGVADSFADMVAKMIAEYMKMALIKGIMSLIPGLGAVAGGLGGGGANLGANSSAVFGLNNADMNQYSSLLPMANGGVLSGGFQAFANGGIVTGPTLGLVGEGRYNEAVIPLPDGKSVPVDLGGAMGGNITSNIVVNVSSDGKMSSSGGGADAAGFGRKLEGAVKQVIAGELRPGGLLSRRN
jgi:tape measure domain-containing protein